MCSYVNADGEHRYHVRLALSPRLSTIKRTRKPQVTRNSVGVEFGYGLLKENGWSVQSNEVLRVSESD